VSSKSPVAMKKVSHVIFDMDGLLLDTEHIYEAAVRDITKSYGKDYPPDVRMKVMGTTEQMTIKIVIDELKLPVSAAEFQNIFTDIFWKRFTKLDLLNGADRLIHHLHRSKVPFCLATSSSQEMAELKMSSHNDLFELFNHKVYGSTDTEVKDGKPAPDIFLIAAKRFQTKPKPSDCLVFEDAPNGVTAAVSAGMQSVMVPDKMVLPEARKQATVVLESLAKFKPEMFGLPPYVSTDKMVQPEQLTQATLVLESLAEFKPEIFDLKTDKIVRPDKFKPEIFGMLRCKKVVVE
jgi:pseudouridine-5'-monophosphatase